MKRLVKFKQSLKLSVNVDNLVSNIAADVRDQVPNDKLMLHKYNTQMILDVCNCVEDLVKKKSKKQIDKKCVVLKVFSDLYEDIDLDIVERVIDFVFENGLIQKSSWLRLVLSFVKKKLLAK
jgi:hypothetical protein